MIPGLQPIFNRSDPANVLASKLKAIYGSDLVSLYIGEDLVINSSNQVISWPARVGISANNTASGYFTRVESTKSKRICLSVPSGTQCLQALDANKARSMWTICNNLTLPFTAGTYPAAIKTNSAATEDSGLVGQAATSQFRALAGARYINGQNDAVSLSATIPTGAELVICEGVNSGAAEDPGVGIRIGSYVADGTWPFPGNIFFAMSLIAIPTDSQRIATIRILGEYYGLSEQTILTMQMRVIFGTSLEGMWVGDDIVVDGSNNITSWPGRVGGTLTNSTAQRFTTGQINGRKSTAPGTIAEAKMLMVNGTANIWSHIALATMAPSQNTYEQITTSYATTTGDIIRNVSTNGIYTSTGFSHKVNDIASEIFPTTGVTILESSGSTVVQPGTGVGGWSGGIRVWPGNIGFVAALTSVPSDTQRAQYLPLLQQYYKFSAQEVLTMQLNAILGASNILGLWFGDDVVVDGSNNITTWNARYGTNAASVGATKATRTLNMLGRSAAIFTASAQDNGYSTQLGAKTQVAIARWDSSLPFPNYCGLLTSNEIPGLIASSGSNAFFAHGTLCRDGVVGISVCDNSVHLWEATSVSATASTGRIGNAIGIAADNWQGPIWFAMQLSTQMTAAQRAASLYAIYAYYGVTPEEVLTMQLKTIFGNTIMGLWLGADAVVDANNKITSLNARIGTNATPAGTVFATKQEKYGRSAVLFTPNASNDVQSYWMATGALTHVVVAQYTDSLPFSHVAVLVNNGATDLPSMYGVSGSSNIGGSSAIYIDGASSVAFNANPHLIETSAATNTYASQLGGYSITGDYHWIGPAWFAMQLSIQMSAAQRSALSAALKGYYTFLP